MPDASTPKQPSRSRDEVAAEIRRFRYRTWGAQPTPDGRWECFFDTLATRGGSRLRTYGATEVEAMERMADVLLKEGIERA